MVVLHDFEGKDNVIPELRHELLTSTFNKVARIALREGNTDGVPRWDPL